MAATLTVYHQPCFNLPFETIQLWTPLLLPASPIRNAATDSRCNMFVNSWTGKDVAKLLEARKDIGLHNYTACNTKQFKCSKLPVEKQIFDNVRIRCIQTLTSAVCCPHVMQWTAAWETHHFECWLAITNIQAKCVNGILNMHTRHYYAFIWGTTRKKHMKK